MIKQGFTKEKAAEWSKAIWVRLGMDPDDKSTWMRERIHMPWHKREPVATFAPKVIATFGLAFMSAVPTDMTGMERYGRPPWRRPH